MTETDVFDSIKKWIEQHGFDTGYVVQKLFWQDRKASDRYIVVQSAGGGRAEEALVRDNFRILVISAQNDSDLSKVHDLAGSIRKAMTYDYSTEYITQMTPSSGIHILRASDRVIFEINFQALISL